jgi:hypothetical protein
MNGLLRFIVFLILWWLALGAWWMLLVGTNAGLELVAAACAASIGVAVAAGIRRRGLLRFRFEPRWLAKTLRAPWKVVREYGVVAWALALHLAHVRFVRSGYRAFPFPTGGADSLSTGRRAVATAADALSPNTIPIDMDCERGLVLRHELVPRKASNELP